MEDYRCPKCKKLLFRGFFVGTIEIKCDKCNDIVEVNSIELYRPKR